MSRKMRIVLHIDILTDSTDAELAVVAEQAAEAALNRVADTDGGTEDETAAEAFGPWGVDIVVESIKEDQ